MTFLLAFLSLAAKRSRANGGSDKPCGHGDYDWLLSQVRQLLSKDEFESFQQWASKADYGDAFLATDRFVVTALNTLVTSWPD